MSVLRGWAGNDRRNLLHLVLPVCVLLAFGLGLWHSFDACAALSNVQGASSAWWSAVHLAWVS